MTIYTIGHSTRPLDEFVALLKAHGITQLVDIRTIPRSRHNPQYEQTALQKSLPAQGVDYLHMKELGGLRPKVKNSVNMAWHNESFRNYADYMQTGEFADGMQRLMELAGSKTTAIMCAEAVPWRCHRSLVADALVARGVDVQDIIGDNEKTTPHKITKFAVVDGTRVTYPAQESTDNG